MQRNVLTAIQKSVLFFGLFLFVSLFSVQKSYGEAAITVGDDVKIKFGVLMQGQIDETQNVGANDGYLQNIFLRRMRLLVGGQVAPNVTFFTETENPNLGKDSVNASNANANAKNINVTNLNTLDAFLTWKVVEPLNLDMGLMFIPLCRNCLQSGALLLPLDYGANTFNESVPTGSNSGRDTGLQARTLLLNDRIEIRLGGFQGTRTTQFDPFRVAGRIQYNFLDTEKTFFYPGTYLGTKKVFEVGAGFDKQGDYTANAFDTFLDLPFGGNMAVTAQVDYIRYMPGQFAAATFADQADWLFEAGLYQSDWKLMPFIQYQDQQKVASGASNGSDVRQFQGGIAYYFAGYNANLKLGAGFKNDDVAGYNNQVTLQLQGFYF